jgi:hypothetical protein
LAAVLESSPDRLQQLLTEEELAERACDRTHWQPLKQELEELRFNRPRRQ